jgi:hypothetical protein
MQKSVFQSKTIWVALIMAILGFVPVASQWVAANPTIFMSITAGIFTVLRLVTNGKISID